MLTEQVAEAYSSNDPFSYYWYDKFFTHDLYDQMVNNLPSHELFEAFHHADATVSQYESTRHRFIFTNDTIKTISPIWEPIYQELISNEFRIALFEKLKVDLLARFGTLDIECKPTVLIYKDFSGYKISPHPDHRTKVATVQFYLPKDSAYEHMGTCIYRIVDKKHVIHQRMKFLPRHGYGFAVSKKSWHGVEPIADKDIERNSLMLIYYQEDEKEKTKKR